MAVGMVQEMVMEVMGGQVVGLIIIWGQVELLRQGKEIMAVIQVVMQHLIMVQEVEAVLQQQGVMEQVQVVEMEEMVQHLLLVGQALLMLAVVVVVGMGLDVLHLLGVLAAEGQVGLIVLVGVTALTELQIQAAAVVVLHHLQLHKMAGTAVQGL